MKKYWMVDQVKPRDKKTKTSNGSLFMNAGFFLSTIIVISASLFYVK